MKPFNLEEYLANPTKRLITRDGCDARIICTDAKSEKYQVVALVTKKGGQEILATFDTSGKYRSGYSNHLDLFFATEKSKIERFDPKTFQPFDKVLARCTESTWVPTLFGFFIDTDNKDPFSPFVLGERVVCVDIGYHQCIPYNEETKHLIGTLDDCPEYYKWWEE